MKNTITVRNKRYSCRIYDNGGETADRYTVVFKKQKGNGGGPYYPYLAMSGDPNSPQGFCQHGETDVIGKHLGKRISFDDMPLACQKIVLSEVTEY